jgi:hypothetical protein
MTIYKPNRFGRCIQLIKTKFLIIEQILKNILNQVKSKCGH